MALTINTNLFSIDTQKNLSNAQQPLATAMQRLSSGLRINSAADDAAGLAIATRMQRQINGFAQDLNNANNGISFAQTAEGTMTEMVNDLQRIYTLSNQSASYNTSLDRGSMNQEVSQLVSELNRVVTQTRYNGQQFLNQAFSANFQVGTEVGETINITTSNVAPNAFGVQASQTDFTNSATNLANIAQSLSISSLNGSVAGAVQGLGASATLAGVSLGGAIGASLIINNSLTVINRINQYTGQTNVTAFSFGNADVATSFLSVAAGTATNATSAGTDFNAGFMTINGIQIGSTTLAAGQALDGAYGATNTIATVAALANAINAKTTQTGVTAEVVSIVGGSVTASITASGVNATAAAACAYSISLVNTTGAAISVSISTANAAANWLGGNLFNTVTANGPVAGNSIAAGQNGQIVFSAPLNTTTVSLGSGSGAYDLDSYALGLASATSIGLTGNQSINNLDITTVGGAQLAILAVEQGLETMNTQKSYLGAVINRFSSTVRSIQNVNENITAAKSRIMDADYAAETANLTKAMITQQAGISVLAQANTITQQVLALLPK